MELEVLNKVLEMQKENILLKQKNEELENKNETLSDNNYPLIYYILLKSIDYYLEKLNSYEEITLDKFLDENGVFFGIGKKDELLELGITIEQMKGFIKNYYYANKLMKEEEEKTENGSQE